MAFAFLLYHFYFLRYTTFKGIFWESFFHGFNIRGPNWEKAKQLSMLIDAPNWPFQS